MEITGASFKKGFLSPYKLPSGRVYDFTALLVIGFTVYVKARLLDFPLERDEGAFAYMARLVLEGKSLYVDGLDFKPPGLYLSYALFMRLFGSTPTGIHTSLLVIVPLSTLIFYMISKELFSPLVALSVTFAFAALSVSPEFLSHASHATRFITLPLLAGLLGMVRFLKKESAGLCFLSGVCMGLTFMMKQPALMFCLLGGVVFTFYGCFAIERRGLISIRYGLIFTAGALLPVIVILIWLIQFTPIERYWFWNFIYPRQYGTVLTLVDGWRNFRVMFPNVVGNFKAIWLAAFSGFIITPFMARRDRFSLLVATLSLFSLAAVVPGLYFRRHYFIVLVPSIALLSGVFLDFLARWLAFWGKSNFLKVPPVIFAIFIISSIYSEREYFFIKDPLVLSREIYGENPFAASVEIGKYIRANSDRDDKIFVFGSEPQIYLYADRESASPVIFTYPLVENNSLAKELQTMLMADLEKDVPAYFIYVNVPFSWSAQPGHDRDIFQRVSEFLKRKFRLEGYVDFLGGRTKYVWGEESVSKPPRGKNSILIFKREE